MLKVLLVLESLGIESLLERGIKSETLNLSLGMALKRLMAMILVTNTQTSAIKIELGIFPALSQLQLP